MELRTKNDPRDGGVPANGCGKDAKEKICNATIQIQWKTMVVTKDQFNGGVLGLLYCNGCGCNYNVKVKNTINNGQRTTLQK